MLPFAWVLTWIAVVIACVLGFIVFLFRGYARECQEADLAAFEQRLVLLAARDARAKDEAGNDKPDGLGVLDDPRP
jgi:hypothetical protein